LLRRVLAESRAACAAVRLLLTLFNSASIPPCLAPLASGTPLILFSRSVISPRLRFVASTALSIKGFRAASASALY